jgi:hypothetical protein
MRYTKFYVLFIISLGIFSSCSDLKNDITAPANLTLHGLNVLNPASSSFHGVTVKDKGLESCKQCHALKLDGGTAMVSCATANCHPNISVHQNKTDINNPASAYYHGLYLVTKKLKMSDCNQCHGSNYSGGIASTACTKCHTTISAHKNGISDPASQNFHGKFVSGLNWNMTDCKVCHGANYSGKVASPSCNTCHKNPSGPEACNTCHGNFSNLTLIAPPNDLSGNTDSKFAGVGSHTAHLSGAKSGPIVQCSVCHIIPTSFSAAGHIDNTPRAELVFKPISVYEIGGASYDFATNKCTNNYCHGGFAFAKANSQYQFAYTADKIEGNNFQPIWNKVDGTQMVCGSCHGLPPKGHMASDLKSCATCHPGVVDQYGKIIDAKKHMDGKINVFGN